MRKEGASYLTVAEEATALIQRQFSHGTLTFDGAYKQLELLRERLYRADGVRVSRVASNSENESILASYVAQKISKRKTKKTSKE